MSPQPADRRQLTLFDATCIMVGIVVGSGIFETPSDVARHSPNPAVLMSLWLAGGLASLLGALCFAELSTRYPEHGGSFVFLNRAYGSWAGLLFAWTDFWIVRPANGGAVAIVLGTYANALVPLPTLGSLGYAIAAVLLATALHLGGLHVGRWSQNAMSLAKIIGLLIVVVVALFSPAVESLPEPTKPTDPPSLLTAFILVMFCFGGWSDLSNVAAEVRDPDRNLMRSLLLGVTVITLIYLAVNAAAIYSLGAERLADTKAFAITMIGSAGSIGARFVAGLVIVCCFGSLSGVLFTGARVYYALGQRHAMFAWLGRWNERRGTPPQSLLAQAAICCAWMGLEGGDEKAFERLIIVAGPCYWAFTLLATLAVIVLRRQDRSFASYRLPFYPLPPLAFAAVCCLLVVSAVAYMCKHLAIEAWCMSGVILSGVLLSIWIKRDR